MHEELHLPRHCNHEAVVRIWAGALLLRLERELTQERDFPDPLAIHLHDDLALKPWAHGVEDALVSLPPLRRLVGQKEAPQAMAHVHGHRAVLHHEVQLVHGRPEGLLVRLEVRDDATDLAEHHGPRNSGDDDHDGGDDALDNIGRPNVSIADGGNRVRREVETCDVQLPNRVLRFMHHVGLLLGEGVNPSRKAVLLLHKDQAQSPEICQPMRDHRQDSKEFQEGQPPVRDRHARLEAREDPRGTKHPDELQQPQHPDDLDGLNLLQILVH
mmetsp:Transcript_36606/g.105276  ORF Transcript_36606/g.105276 Transcript_36606/m.105276 type:complete len:271 (-) Transcript_36606:1070-1882(-)